MFVRRTVVFVCGCAKSFACLLAASILLTLLLSCGSGGTTPPPSGGVTPPQSGGGFGFRDLGWCAASGATALAVRTCGQGLGWSLEGATFVAALAV